MLTVKFYKADVNFFFFPRKKIRNEVLRKNYKTIIYNVRLPYAEQIVSIRSKAGGGKVKKYILVRQG